MPTPSPASQQPHLPPPSAPAPALPATPAAPGGGPTISLPGVPQSAEQLMSLRARGSELAAQLTSARMRRDGLARRLDRGDPDVRGLQQQVNFLDDRILNLEKAIDQNGQLIANAAPGLLTEQPFPFPITPRSHMLDPTPIFIVFILFVLAPLAIGFVVRSLRRHAAPVLPPGWNEHLQRMDRLEQAIDTVAIEIERISEGQRFLTKTLADRVAVPNGGVPQRPPEPVAVPAPAEGVGPKALAPGAMEPIHTPQRETVAEKR